MPDEMVLREVAYGIATLTLNNPKKRNDLSIQATIGTLTGDGGQPISSNVGAGLIACTTRVSGSPDTKIEWEDEIPHDPVVFL